MSVSGHSFALPFPHKSLKTNDVPLAMDLHFFPVNLQEILL